MLPETRLLPSPSLVSSGVRCSRLQAAGVSAAASRALRRPPWHIAAMGGLYSFIRVQGAGSRVPASLSVEAWYLRVYGDMYVYIAINICYMYVCIYIGMYVLYAHIST